MFGETITRKRAATKTLADRTTVRDWDNTTSVELEHMNVQPLSQQEIVDRSRHANVVQFRVYSRPWSIPDIDPLDRIVWRGDTYTVDGQPQVWPDPVTGRDHHVVFIMERVKQ